MDNDNKVNEQKEAQTHKEVQLFLKEELKTLGYSSAAAYDLEQEYAQTRHNKSKAVYVILASCFVVVALMTIGLGSFIRSSNNKIKVNIDTFDDLNLRALLNSAGRAENLYQNALREREMLIAARDDELNAAEQKRENDLFTLKSVAKVSSKKAVSEKQAAIQEEYKKTVKAVKEKYGPKILEADREIADYQQNLSSFDAEKLSKAQESEAALDSQKQLNDMERSNIEKRYQDTIKDLKTQMALQQREAVKQQREAVEEVRKIYQAKIDLLDPDARSQSKVQDKIILDTGIPKSARTTAAIEFKQHFDGSLYTKNFASPSENFTSSVKQASESLEDLNTIANRFSTIPLENTIRHYVPAMQRLAYEITTNMAEGQSKMQQEIVELQNAVQQKNSQIDDMGRYFDSLCLSDKSNPADGVIISSQNKQQLGLYLTKSALTKIGEPPQIEGQIREGKKVICDVVVTKNGAVFEASPKQEAKASAVNAISVGQKLYLK